jgi:short-subunit dehydrogenase
MSTELKGRTALVTGASSGIGADFARELAARGCNLILVARRAEVLESLARELRAGGIKVVVMPADLSADDHRERLAQQVESAGLQVDVLVNNAGFGVFGNFADTDWSRLDQMLQLDVVALTHLTRLFVPAMVRRGFGRILQVGSTGAFQPSPGYASYAAAKSYVLNFGIALNYELKGSGVSCTVLNPGVTATEFFSVAGQNWTWYQRSTAMQPRVVAGIGVRAMVSRKPSVVAGLLNQMMAFTTRLSPRPMTAAIVHELMKN